MFKKQISRNLDFITKYNYIGYVLTPYLETRDWLVIFAFHTASPLLLLHKYHLEYIRIR